MDQITYLRIAVLALAVFVFVRCIIIQRRDWRMMKRYELSEEQYMRCLKRSERQFCIAALTVYLFAVTLFQLIAHNQ